VVFVGDGGSTTGKFGTAPVEILTKMFSGLQGTGFDMSKLLNTIGIKPEDAMAMLNSATKTENDGTATVKPATKK
jgi:hypothetical protein